MSEPQLSAEPYEAGRTGGDPLFTSPRSSSRKGTIDFLTPDSDTTKPITSEQHAYNLLRTRLINGSIPDGTRLTQKQVAEAFSMSTTPVREAFRRLASDGLIQIDAYRGAIAQRFDKRDLIDIYELRAILEPLSLRKAVPLLTESHLRHAEELCERMEDSTDLDQWVKANSAFHEVLTSPVEAPTLITIVDSLRNKAAPYVGRSILLDPAVPMTANSEHKELLAACKKRDADAAAEIERLHLERTLGIILSKLPTDN